jgi:anti-anti-sigma regulatory factor
VPTLLGCPGVECRIQVQQQAGGCTIHLAGRFNAAQVHELRGACAVATGFIRIDLTDLVSADAVGLDALQRLRIDGAEIVGVAPYLRRWMT